MQVVLTRANACRIASTVTACADRVEAARDVLCHPSEFVSATVLPLEAALDFQKQVLDLGELFYCIEDNPSCDTAARR